ncbi:MAG TPA: hypothetical protein VM221_08545 [Armatimonadota bacterium]|nr:hypothetical protein [Armatimonadota bacterium]
MRSLITDNPVVRREARLRFWRTWPRYVKLAALIGSAGGVALLAKWSLWFIPGGKGNAANASLLVMWGVTMAVAAALVGARSVAGEREVRTWEQVIITRLRPRHIIAGKVLGVMWQVAVPAGVLAPGLWIWLLHTDHLMAGPAPDVLALLFAPAGQVAGFGSGSGSYPGAFWLFAASLLWIAQGAAIGVFASLRYRSTVTSGAVALLLLAITLGLDLTFLLYGGYILASDVSTLGVAQLAIITIVGSFVFPILPILIIMGLAAYEFAEFDRWLQTSAAGAGR